MTEILTVNVDMTFNEEYETEAEFRALVKKYTKFEIVEIDDLHNIYNGFATVTVKGTLQQFLDSGYDKEEIEEWAE